MTTDPNRKIDRRFKKIKIDLMRKKEFVRWTGLMMVGKTEIRDDVPTACTNGRDEIYGRDFINNHNDQEIAWTILHENSHKMFRHMTTWQKLFKECAPLANMAADHVINLMLDEMDPEETHLKRPRKPDGSEWVCFDKRFKGMHTKQVYDILKSETKFITFKGGGKGQGQPQDGQDGDGGGYQFDEHDWEGAEELSEQEKKDLEKEIDRAVRQGEIMHNKLNGDGTMGRNKELGELLAPQIDWKELLREFVTSLCSGKDSSSWRRVSRRYLADDIYMPTMISERVGRIAVGVDASGSTWVGNVHELFLSEVKAVIETVRPDGIDLIYWDTEVTSHKAYGANEIDNLIGEAKITGGGGTLVSCMEKFLKKEKIKPECIIILTDGHLGSDWGKDWDGVPILWVIAGNPDCMAPIGKSIHINE